MERVAISQKFKEILKFWLPVSETKDARVNIFIKINVTIGIFRN